MTNREFYDAVINANVNAEITEFAQACKDKLDSTNAKRKEKSIEKAAARDAERAPIREAIVNCLTSEPKTATTLINEAGVEIKPQMMHSLLKGLIETGTVVKGEVKVAGKGKQVGYAIA